MTCRSGRGGVTAGRTVGPAMALAVAVGLGSCEEAPVFQPAGTRFVVDLRGTVFDGRAPAGTGVPGRVAVFTADGRTPVRVDEDHILETDPDGRFAIILDASLPEPVLVLEATAHGPLLPVRKAFDVGASPVRADLYLSTTLITGHLSNPDGAPGMGDIWVLRDQGDGDFLPFEFAGGRAFRPPLPPGNLRFGLDTDALGNFTISVGGPDARFRLIFFLDRTEVRPESFLTAWTDVFVTEGQENRVTPIRLMRAGSDQP